MLEGKSGAFMEVVLQIVANVFTIAASGIAIYLFLFKREAISRVFKILLNYSFQITLTELKAKLERLNDLTMDDTNQASKVVNILGEISGQMRGNKQLRMQCPEIMKTIEHFVKNPRKLTEPRKRSLIHELRENLRTINLENFDYLIGGQK